MNQSIVSPPPTEAESVVDDPLQTVGGFASGLAGVPGRVLTVTVTWAHAVLVQPVVVCRARPKYVVVLLGLTPSEVPVPTSVPPQLPVYQSMVSPAPAVAERADEAPLQIAAGVADGLPGVAGCVLTVTETCAHVAPAQPVVVFRARA